MELNTLISKISDIINLDKYPIHDLESEAGRVLLAKARQEFNSNSLIVLNDFLRPEIVSHLAAETLEDDVTKSFCFTGSNNVFLGTQEVQNLSPDHPSYLQKIYTKRTLACDQISSDSPLKVLFQWNPLVTFVSSIVGQEVYRSADKLGAMTVHIHHNKDEQDWHFDVSEYTIVLHILAPQKGGVLEYVPCSRSEVEEDTEALAKIIRGDRHSLTKDLPTIPGVFVLHSGKLSMHRVTPVEGTIPRISATMSFNRTPNFQLNEYTRQLYFGRNE
ncbi:hypothetical protein E5S67_01865 [Microcoleus sp. IPMA8]|uniref:Fe2OG dioxygenase domain-containing protein n=1 Tax=Microcoleus asticus IPMA8 TaxID=2563858 RepID=A0ABX2CWN0_9CYAN|nr:hypothetical protein [Microcoleus asticus IPMA8]